MFTAGTRGVLSVLFLLPFMSPDLAAGAPATPNRADSAVLQRFMNLPLAFEPLESGPGARYIARGNGYVIGLEKGRAVIGLPDAAGKRGKAIGLEFAGGKPADAVPGAQLPGTMNIIHGNNREKWQLGLPTFGKIAYPNVYPGIDVVYYGNQRHLEFDLVVQPGADPSAIRLKVKGATGLRLSGSGSLLIQEGGRELTIGLPDIYQETAAGRKNVAGKYVLQGRDEVAFSVEKWDRARALVIDPTLVYSGLIGGGTNSSSGNTVATDAGGNIYVAGYTYDTTFPTVNPAQAGNAGSDDGFVFKMNPAGTALLYSTYLGGSNYDNFSAIAPDSAGAAWVTGQTSSSDFPTLNPTQATFGGYYDAVAVKLSATGTLQFSTYLGGSGYDYGNGIALDGSGNAYVAGGTESADLPTTSGALKSSMSSFENGFVTKFSSAGARAYSTYVGGNNSDWVSGIAVDSAGNAYLTGVAYSSTFTGAPAGGPQTANAGSGDAFVAKLNPAGTAMPAFTFLGGANNDFGRSIVLDSSGNVYVAGYTSSVGLATSGAAQHSLAGAQNGFVAKLNAAGTSFTYITYIGGNRRDTPQSLAVDSAGNAYIAGSTDSNGFPSVAALQPAYPGNPTSLFQTNSTGASWAPFDSNVPGAVFDLSVDPSNSGTIIAATEAGIFRSVNNGASWSPWPFTGSVSHVSRSAAAPATVYACSSNQIFRSTDGGNTWTYQGFLNNGCDGGLVADPITAATVYGFSRYSSNIQVSRDGGVTWFAANAGLGTFSVNALVAAPDGSLYAGTNAGVYKSVNQGTSWTAVTSLPASYIYPGGLSVSGSTVYAAYSSVYKSADGGAHWTTTAGSVPNGAYLVAASPANANILYATGFSSNIYVSADAGATWNTTGTGPTSTNVSGQTAFLFDPSNASRAFFVGPVSEAGFVAELNAAGSAFLYSTYFGSAGGTSSTNIAGIAINAAGEAIVTGYSSPGTGGAFPATSNAFRGGTYGAFVARIANSTSSCAVALSPATQTIGAYTQTAAVSVIAPSGCSWTGTSDQSWATLTRGASGTGTDVISLQFATNTGATRTATISAGGQSVTITQESQSCYQSFSPNSFTVPQTGGSISSTLSTGAGCPWTISNTYPSAVSITSGLSGTGSATVNATVAANPGQNYRNFYLASSWGQFNIVQAGTCRFTFTPTSASPTAAGGAASLSFTTSSPTCQWNVGNYPYWVTFTGSTSGTGSGTVSYTVAANTGVARTGVINIGGLDFTISQAAAPVTITGMQNGASFTSPPLAPGSVASIFGSNLANSSTNSGSTLPLTLAGVSVTINGAAAPISYVSPTQINIQIPWATASGTASVIVNNNGTASNAFSFTVAPFAPGIFLNNSAGYFQNQDNTTNSATSPAPPGSTVTVYFTGGGAVTPSVADGALPGSSGSTLNGTLTATIGGVAATVSSARLSSSSVGWDQATLRIPASLATGTYPVILTENGVSSPAANISAGIATLQISTGSNLGTSTIGSTQIALNATGGTGAYSWSLTSGSLPPGLNIGVRPYSVPNIGLVGVATTPGNYSFTLAVTDGNTTVSQAFTLRITGLILKDPSIPNAFAGTPYSYQLTALNNAGTPVFTVTNSSLPAGLTLDSGGLLHGTVAAGIYQVSFTVSDGPDTIYRGFQLYVSALNITTPSVLPNGMQGSAYPTQTLTASGGTAPYTFTNNGGLPSGLTMSASGVISGTITSGAGEYRTFVTVTDANNLNYSKNILIDVIGTPPALMLLRPYDTTSTWGDAIVGGTYSNGVNVCCGGTAPFTWTVTGLPAGMSLRSQTGNEQSYISPGDAEIWGAASVPGTYNVTIKVTDANNVTVTNTFPLHVSELDLPNYLPSGTINTPYSFTGYVIGGTPNYSVTQASGLSYSPQAAGLTLTPPTASSPAYSFSGTPVENGSFTSVFNISDGAGHTLRRVNYYNISNVAGASVQINNGANQVIGLGNTSLQLSACCVASTTWSLVGGTLPGGMTLSSGGLLSGTPAAAGTYRFLIKAADTAGVAAPGFRQFVLLVTPLSIGGSPSFGQVGTAYSATLTATGGTGALTWSVLPGYYLPPGVTFSSAGVFAGTPTTTGQFYLAVQVTDAAGNTQSRYFTFNVYAAGAYPPLNITTSASQVYVTGTVQAGLDATGGTGTYVWSLAAGSTLPPGLALRTDVPSYFLSTTQAGIMGVATTPGTYTFTVNATSAGNTVSKTLTVKITSLNVADPNLQDAFVSTPYSYQLTPVGQAAGATVTFSAASSPFPSWLSLSASGKFTGTPPASGSYQVGFNVSDGTNSTYNQYTLYVYAIQITTPGLLPNATQGSVYPTQTIVATGGSGGYTYTLSGGLPSGLTLDPAAGTISGTVTSGPTVDEFWIIATDSNRVSYTKRFTLNVIGVPATLPRIQVFRPDDLTVGNRWNTTVNVCCGGVAPYTWTASGLPPGIMLRQGAAISTYDYQGQAELFGAPQTAGTYPVVLTVTDGAGNTTSAPFPLVVSVLDVNPGLPAATLGQPYSSTMRVLGGSGPYTTQFVGGEMPAGLALQPGTLTVAGTPIEDYNCCDSPKFQFSDSAGHTYFRTMGLQLNTGTGQTIRINSRGYFSYDLGSSQVGTSYSTSFSACCVPSYTWAFVSGTLPPGLTLSAGGVLSGTPTTAGVYTFLISVADPTNPANIGYRQFLLHITPFSISNSGTLPFATVGNSYNYAFTTSGTTGAITWSTVFSTGNSDRALPPGLAISPGTGVLSGTPTSPGNYQFDVIANDTAGNSYIRTFTISVYPAGQVPPLFLGTGPVANWTLGRWFWQQGATGGVPPYHYSLTPGAAPVPGFRVQDGGPPPSFLNPANGTGYLMGVATTPGTYNTSIRVTDSTGATFDRALTVNIFALNLLDQGTLPRATVGVPYSYTLHPVGGTVAYTFASSNLPAGLSIDPTSGTISGTPTTASNFGSTITLGDTSLSSSFGFGETIPVNPFDITTPATVTQVLPKGAVNTAYSVQFAAPGCGAGCMWSVSGTLPTGIVLDSATGLLHGTPTSTGGYNTAFTILATNGATSAQKSWFLTIPPTVSSGLQITTGVPSANITVGSTSSLTLNASGGTPPYNFTLASGSTLPPGFSLQGPGETIGANFAAGFQYIAGRALQAGTYNFTVKVSDSAGTPNTATKAFTWTVSPLSLEYTSLPVSYSYVSPNLVPNPALYGQAYSQPLLVIGGSGNYTTWTTASSGQTVYPGLTVNASTGVVSGTPANTGGSTTLINITDSAGNSLAQNLTVSAASDANRTITLGGPAAGTLVALGSSGLYSLVPSGGVAPAGGVATYTLAPLAGTTLPAGVALVSGNAFTTANPATYGFQFTPVSPGTVTFTLQATDNASGSVGYRTYVFVVSSFNAPISQTLADGSVGFAYSNQLYTSGSGSWSLTPGYAYPPGLTVSSTGLLSGTPTAAGTYTFSLNLSDGSTTLGYGFTLRVSGLHITNPLQLPNGVIGAPYGGAAGYQFTATGGTNLTWSSTALPAGLSLSAAGLLTGTPTGRTNATFTLTVTDGVVQESQLFTLPITPQNPTVLSLNATSAVLSDAVLNQNYRASISPDGGLPPYTIALASGSTLPPGLRLYYGTALPSGSSVTATQLFGAPTASGHYSFNLVATDAVGATVTRTYTLNVTPITLAVGNPHNAIVNAAAPQAYSDQLVALGGTAPYTFSYATASLGQDALPAGLTMDSHGLISGTPTSTGLFSFILTVTDAAGNKLVRTLSLLATNPNGLYINTSNQLRTAWNQGITIIPAASGSSTYVWSATASTVPGLSFSNTSTPPTLTYSRATPGVFTMTLRATDTADATNFAERVLTVVNSPTQVVTPPSTALFIPDLPAATVGSAYSYTFRVAGGSAPYTFVESPLVVLPPGLSLSSAGVLSGTPTQSGYFGLTVEYTDSTGLTFFTSTTLPVIAAGGKVPLLLVSNSLGTGILNDASAGVPYTTLLDRYIQGGAAPYAWTVTSGSTLPPGLGIAATGGNTGNYLTGVPATAGSYTFSLTATDSGGQMLTIPFSLNVSALAITATVPQGMVGTPYTATFVPSGGTAPYTISMSPRGVPGLTATGGTLTGTPLLPGIFQVTLTLTDSAGQTLLQRYEMQIDNAAGQAPSIAVGPKPVNIFYTQGDPVPGVTLNLSASSGHLPFTASVTGIPAASLSAVSATASGIASLSFNAGTLATVMPGSYAGLISVNSPTSVNGFDSTPVLLTVGAARPCTFSLNPDSASVGAAGGTGNIQVTATSSCSSWTPAISDSGLITVSGASPVTGSATLNYTVSANPGSTQRSGTITVGDQVFTITQFAPSTCSYAISPARLSATASGGTAQINVTASASTCAWSATGLSPSPASGTGNGQVTVTLPANSSPSPQSLTATIAGQTLTVTQASANCSVMLGSSSAALGASGGGGTVTVTTPAGCGYDTVLGPSWISATSGASGNGPTGTLTYSVAANSGTAARSGSLTIGGQPFQITQSGVSCSFSLDTTGLGSPFGTALSTGTLAITANGANCPWSASSGSSFVTVSPAGGTGNGTVTVTVSSNTASSSGRMGTVSIAGQTINFSQGGTTCAYSLRSSMATVPFAGGSSAVGVLAPSACSWTASSNATWLTASPSASGGSADVQFTAAPNPAATSRTAALTIAGQTYTVMQAGAPCTYALGSSVSPSIAAAGAGPQSVTVTTAQSGCTAAGAAVVSYANWLTASNSSGSGGSGTVTYSVAANPSGSARNGTLQVGDKLFTVSQIGSACAFSLDSYGIALGAAGGTGTLAGSQSAVGCTPVVGTTQPAIVSLGTLAGPVTNTFTQPYTVNVFTSATRAVRRALITFGGQIFTVKQTSW